MKYFLIILLALMSLNITAQSFYLSDPCYLPKERPQYILPTEPMEDTPYNMWRQSKRTAWKKTVLNVGSSILSVAFEMTGDALYDMGKASGNKSQMQWGHTLQATGYVVPLIAIPFLVKRSDNKVIKDVAIIVGTYGLMRFATADLAYNLTAGLDPLYAGVTTQHDNVMSKMTPAGRFIYKGFSFTLGFAINLSYW